MYVRAWVGMCACGWVVCAWVCVCGRRGSVTWGIKKVLFDYK